MIDAEILKKLLEKQGKQIVGFDITVTRLFLRRDGFKDSDETYYDYLTKEQFAILIRRSWKIPLIKRIKLNADEQIPPYWDSDSIEFHPKSYEFSEDKKKLNILYEEF